ncbi:immunity protein YezG family protein [Staphylococcus haemolyticus]|uniref:immunity protein YezG family protein n=1 Tax=Staphylococcus TaxID=1279 RepID=UPI00069E778D|nr:MULTISPECIES: immunity protein YezG family protein [Staphylococcus]KAA2274823.1 TIGR01741 family protein [Staphylococcus sp. GDX7P312P]KAA2277247.1 TIGR01741 family protein [Staphylococcus sp. GDX7P459A]MCE4954514.1 TIGR01741 family protein [Staphylococcus haemolyticus]PTK79628.1 TIGR01741 family protein [Staphylococcus haemolyticus]PTL03488.1 TIGR01741 family protein [Staphylococcus haemolyticus]
MDFENNLKNIYQNIATKVNEIMPNEWNNIFIEAEVTLEGGSIFFFYTLKNYDGVFYSLNIPDDFNISEKKYNDLENELYEKFEELNLEFKKYNQEVWTTCTFILSDDGKANISFGYINWLDNDFTLGTRIDYFKYKYFGKLPEQQRLIDEVKQLEQFIKEQEEQ